MTTMTDKPAETDNETLHRKLNLETGRLSWPELQRHFARGVVITLDPELDLVEVAARFAEDDREHVGAWLEQGRISRASDADARRWSGSSPDFWAIVVAPWVLVQEMTPQ